MPSRRFLYTLLVTLAVLLPAQVTGEDSTDDQTTEDSNEPSRHAAMGDYFETTRHGLEILEPLSQALEEYGAITASSPAVIQNPAKLFEFDLKLSADDLFKLARVEGAAAGTDLASTSAGLSVRAQFPSQGPLLDDDEQQRPLVDVPATGNPAAADAIPGQLSAGLPIRSPDGLTLNVRDQISLTANDFLTLRLLEFTSAPTFDPQTKLLLGMVLNISVRPGWRTEQGYTGEIDIHPRLCTSEDGGCDGVDRVPLAFALFPGLDSQVLDQRSSLGRQLALALELAVQAPQIGGALNAQHVRRLEERIATLSAINTVVGYNQGGTHFGWRFSPRVVALQDPSAPRERAAEVLESQTFPALAFLLIDKDDIPASIGGLCPDLTNTLRGEQRLLTSYVVENLGTWKTDENGGDAAKAETAKGWLELVKGSIESQAKLDAALADATANSNTIATGIASRLDAFAKKRAGELTKMLKALPTNPTTDSEKAKASRLKGRIAALGALATRAARECPARDLTRLAVDTTTRWARDDRHDPWYDKLHVNGERVKETSLAEWSRAVYRAKEHLEDAKIIEKKQTNGVHSKAPRYALEKRLGLLEAALLHVDTVSAIPKSKASAPVSLKVVTPGQGWTDKDSWFALNGKGFCTAKEGAKPPACKDDIITSCSKNPDDAGCGTQVLFGGTRAEIAVITPSKMVVKVPKASFENAPGTVDVAVYSPGGVAALAKPVTFGLRDFSKANAFPSPPPELSSAVKLTWKAGADGKLYVESVATQGTVSAEKVLKALSQAPRPQDSKVDLNLNVEATSKKP